MPVSPFSALLSYLNFAMRGAMFGGTGNLSPVQNAALGAAHELVTDLAAAHTGDTGPQVALIVTGKMIPFVEQLADVIFPQAAPEIDLAASIVSEIKQAVQEALYPVVTEDKAIVGQP